MLHNNTKGRKLFIVSNYVILILVSLSCLLPLLNVLAISLSSSTAVSAGEVWFWPVEFTTKSYEYVASTSAYIKALGVSIHRVVLGVGINMLLTILAAYPLSKEKSVFRLRGQYAWYFLLTILFSGGMIPTYMVIKQTYLIDTIWALVLPTALPVFNMIVLLNFFRQIPKELEEAAHIDGADHWKILFRIYLPLSTPALATLVLFCFLNHWNAWFDGLLYMNRPQHYPLQSYLQTIVINVAAQIQAMSNNGSGGLLDFVNQRTNKSAQIVLAMIPVIIIYPFLQKYFTKGLILGSVKG